MTDVVEVVVGAVDVVEVITAGPPGPRGPAGAGGDGWTAGYEHTQSTPATVWTITHELGYDPGGVLVVDAGGYVMDEFGVQILESGVSLRLSFDISFAGAAYLS